MNKSELMRVPSEFKHEVKKITKKHGYESMNQFLRDDGIRIYKNASMLTSAAKKFKGIFMRDR